MTQEYEYKTIHLRKGKDSKRREKHRDEVLNEYAREGWEVVESQRRMLRRKDTVTLQRRLDNRPPPTVPDRAPTWKEMRERAKERPLEWNPTKRDFWKLHR